MTLYTLNPDGAYRCACAAGFYLLGASCTSLMSIALTFATGFNEVPPTALAADLVYWVGAGFVLVGLVAAMVLLRSDIGSKTLSAKDAASKRHRVQSLQRGNSGEFTHIVQVVN